MIIEKIWKGGGKHSQKQLNIYYIRSRKRTAGFICSIYYGFKEFVFIRRLDTVILCLILAFYLLLSSMVNHLLALVSKNFWAKISRWACFNEGLVDARSMTRAWMKFMLVDIPNSDSTVVFGFDSYAMFTNKDLNSSVCQSQVMMAPSLVRAAQRCIISHEFVDSRGGDEAFFGADIPPFVGFLKRWDAGFSY